MNKRSKSIGRPDRQLYLQFQLHNAIIVAHKNDVTAVFLYGWSNAWVQQLLDHHHRFVIVIVDLCICIGFGVVYERQTAGKEIHDGSENLWFQYAPFGIFLLGNCDKITAEEHTTHALNAKEDFRCMMKKKIGIVRVFAGDKLIDIDVAMCR